MYYNHPRNTFEVARTGFKTRYTLGSTVRIISKSVRPKIPKPRAVLSRTQYGLMTLLTKMCAAIGRAPVDVRTGLQSAQSAIADLRRYRNALRDAASAPPRPAIETHYILEAYWQGSWHLIYDYTYNGRTSLDWTQQKQILDRGRAWLIQMRRDRRMIMARRSDRWARLLEVARAAKMPTTGERWASIELECMSKGDVRTVAMAMVRAGLMRFTCVKSDSSISCVAPYGYPIECVITAPLDKIADIVPKVTKVLLAVGAKVNTSCGLHVHYDCRNDSAHDVYARLQRAQHLLFAAVPVSRRDNRYCRMSTALDYNAACRFERYVAVNARAYDHHKTIEVRLGSATLDPVKIVSWVALLGDIAYTEQTLPAQPVRTLSALKEAAPKLAESTIRAIASRIQRYSPTAGQALLV